MAFSNSDVEICWRVAGGKCECMICSHRHPGDRCNMMLDWNKRGRGGDGYWEAHHLDENPNDDSLGNCGIFCWPCHDLTL